MPARTLDTPPAPEGAAAASPAVRRWVAASALPVTLLVQAAASAAVIAPAIAAPRLLADLALGPVAVGLYIALVYLGAMFSSQWGAGWIARLGPIFTSQRSLLFCAVGLMLVSVPNVAAAAVGAALIGVGYGPITPASSAMLARTTSPARYSLVFSVKQTGVPLGGALAGLLVPTVLSLAGTKGALGQIALLCVAGVALAELLRRDLDRHRDAAAPAPTLTSLVGPIRFVLEHDALRKLALCSMVFSVVQVCLTSYLVTFLTGDLRWGLVAAGAASSMAQAAGVAGRVLWGVAADKRRNAREVMIVLAAAMAACSLAFGLLPQATPHAWVIAVLVVYGATAIGWNGVYLATVARLVPLEQAATATSGSLFFTYFGVVIGPPLFGVVAGATGGLAFGFLLLAIPLAWAGWALQRADWRSHD